MLTSGLLGYVWRFAVIMSPTVGVKVRTSAHVASGTWSLETPGLGLRQQDSLYIYISYTIHLRLQGVHPMAYELLQKNLTYIYIYMYMYIYI